MLVPIVAEFVRRFVQIGWIMAILIPLEVLWPRAPISWLSRLRGLTLWVVYSAITAAAMFALWGVLLAPYIHPLFGYIWPEAGWARLLAILAASVVYGLGFDFFYYWFHRLQHTPVLWRFHAVHHSLRDMNALNSCVHWTEELPRIPLILTPWLLLFPTPPATAVWVTNLIALQSYFLHAQTRVHFGPFWRVLYDPRFHRIHHSVEPRHHNRNFGVLTPLWDWMFGTLCVPASGEWAETGLPDQAEAESLGDYLWRPFLPRSARPLLQ